MDFRLTTKNARIDTEISSVDELRRRRVNTARTAERSAKRVAHSSAILISNFPHSARESHRKFSATKAKRTKPRSRDHVKILSGAYVSNGESEEQQETA